MGKSGLRGDSRLEHCGGVGERAESEAAEGSRSGRIQVPFLAEQQFEQRGELRLHHRSHRRGSGSGPLLAAQKHPEKQHRAGRRNPRHRQPRRRLLRLASSAIGGESVQPEIPRDERGRGREVRALRLHDAVEPGVGFEGMGDVPLVAGSGAVVHLRQQQRRRATRRRRRAQHAESQCLQARLAVDQSAGGRVLALCSESKVRVQVGWVLRRRRVLLLPSLQWPNPLAGTELAPRHGLELHRFAHDRGGEDNVPQLRAIGADRTAEARCDGRLHLQAAGS
ncbi:unnamed protein product [Linum tenue]|uniref:Uncharacterized protein n=1 Tax=Linum tenue TaxID=586396 RepID=A0AAV0H2Q0_9ROSI|nr:unnamed protein product [Linum tenue]